MRASLTLIAVAAISTGLLAQTASRNELYRYDRTTEFTSRGSVGSDPGFVSQGFSFGHSAGLDKLTQTQLVMQDQDASTRERWDVGTCLLDNNGDPDYANPNYYATNMQNPAATGIAAWLWTFTPQTPHTVGLKNPDEWHHVWHFQETTNWTTDGISVHMSQAAPWNNTLQCLNGSQREIPRTDGTPAAQIIEGLGISMATKTPPVKPAVQNRTWRLRTNWATVVLNGGAKNDTYMCTGTGNPNVGYASLDPDFDDTGTGNPGRFDDYNWHLEAGAPFANGAAIMFWSTTVFPGTGINIPGWEGSLNVDITDRLFAVAGPLVMPALDATGRSDFLLTLGSSTSPLRKIVGSFASWSAQAAVIHPQSGRTISNLFSFRPKLLPAPFKAGQTSTGTPFKTTVPVAQHRRVEVRNDGRGVITVQLKRNGVNIGPAFVVGERTMVQAPVPAAANELHVTTSNQNNVDFVYGLY